MSRIGIDLFCGAGGMTQGATQAGIDVKFAINHWHPAIESHRQNHPDCAHWCAKLSEIDPYTDPKVPRNNIFVLFGGPSCTHHSTARGGKPVNDQMRTHPYEMLAWVDACRPKWLIVENVPEFQNWGPLGSDNRPLKSRKGETFQAWINSLRSHNYVVEWRVLNAADFGSPTKRKRLFVVARRGNRKIPWPEPTHAPAEKAEQLGLKPWRPVAECIDWSDLGASIFNRKKPLADNTVKRIEAGLRKFVTKPFVYRMHGPGSRDERHIGAYDVDSPIPTLLQRNVMGIVSPFLSVYHNGDDSERRTASIDEPIGTLDTQNRYGLTLPFMVNASYAGRDDESRCHSLEEPMRTLTSKPNKCLVQPFLVPNFGERKGQTPRTHSVDDPSPAVTSHGAGVLISAFLVKYYGTGGAVGVSRPIDTLTAKARFGLATANLVETMGELGVADVFFRMLKVPELLTAQGFPSDYELIGTKTEQTRMIGNSVPPHLMHAICNSICN